MSPTRTPTLAAAVALLVVAFAALPGAATAVAAFEQHLASRRRQENREDAGYSLVTDPGLFVAYVSCAAGPDRHRPPVEFVAPASH